MKPLYASLMALLLALPVTTFGQDLTYELDVLPPDHTVMTDSVTGATLTFLTTNTPSTALYFHEYSWLSDESMIVFRGGPLGLLGYITETGELAKLTTPDGGIGGVTAAASRPSVFGMRGRELVELAIRIEPREGPDDRSTVEVAERVIATLPFGGQLNPRIDDRFVSIGNSEAVYIVETDTGELRKICDITPPLAWSGHLQWSRSDLYHLSWASGSDAHRAGDSQRIQVVDIREGEPWAPYSAREDELVTHESWWVDGQMLFCGALRPGGQDQSHVKVLDPMTGTVRIAGAGAWWPGATASELAERNWWHCAGSADGRWIIADNWHGTLMLFEGTTARPRTLTVGHRTYGRGTHPEPGWDREGRRVIFSSHLLSDDVNACVADIPEEWQEANPAAER